MRGFLPEAPGKCLKDRHVPCSFALEEHESILSACAGKILLIEHSRPGTCQETEINESQGNGREGIVFHCKPVSSSVKTSSREVLSPSRNNSGLMEAYYVSSV